MAGEIEILPPENEGNPYASLEKDYTSLHAQYSKEELQQNFLWVPQRGPQEYAWRHKAFELFYGGARGGGKTDYLLGSFLSMAAKFGPGAQGIIFRRTYKQLDEVVRRGKQLYEYTGLGKFAKGDMAFVFDHEDLRGARLALRYLEAYEDAEEYQGHSFAFIGFDELPNFKDFRILELMRACARSTYPGLEPVIRATGNPGGRLHNEVKSYFIDPEPQGFKEITDEEGLTRLFVPSKLTDNAILVENNPNYEKFLRSIKDEQLRKAWLEGCWDVALGSFFSDVWSREFHVVDRISAHDIPEHWPRYRAFDWGSAKPFGCLWFIVASDDKKFFNRDYSFPKGSIVVYRELYGCKKGHFDTGVKLTAVQVAKAILDAERRDGDVHVKAGPADHAIWAQQDGPSIGEKMGKLGAKFTRADKSRIPGWEQVRIRLVGHDRPMIYFTADCTHTIRTLPILARDDKCWEDIESSQEDHLADVVRYICMSRKMPALSPEAVQERSRRERPQVLDEIMGM